MRHWYCLSFVDGDGGNLTHASVYLGWDDQKITKPRIAEAKRGAEVGEDSVLMAVSYLGYMTHEEVTGDEQATTEE